MPTFGDHKEDETAKEILHFYVYLTLSGVRGIGDLELWKDIARMRGEKVTEKFLPNVRSYSEQNWVTSYSSSKSSENYFISTNYRIHR